MALDIRSPWRLHTGYLSAGAATRVSEAWMMKREHLHQPCQQPLGFILAWPRKILGERVRGPRALWSAVNQLQEETAKALQWRGSALQSRLGGDYQPDPLSWEPEDMTQTAQTATACQGGWQWALQRDSSLSGVYPHPSPLAAVAESGPCAACEVIWIPWQPASTWILSKPQESSGEKVNIPAEPVLISKEGYWRRNWGWGTGRRMTNTLGSLPSFQAEKGQACPGPSGALSSHPHLEDGPSAPCTGSHVSPTLPLTPFFGSQTTHLVFNSIFFGFFFFTLFIFPNSVKSWLSALSQKECCVKSFQPNTGST